MSDSDQISPILREILDALDDLNIPPNQWAFYLKAANPDTLEKLQQLDPQGRYDEITHFLLSTPFQEGGIPGEFKG